MKENKFRAWHKVRKEWIYITLNHGSTTVDVFEVHAAFDGDLEPWQQFTGLKDKNGKEIWEGDILGSERTALGIVSFNRGRFVGHYFYHPTTGGWAMSEEWEDELYQRGDLEVIGNIYENPELFV